MVRAATFSACVIAAFFFTTLLMLTPHAHAEGLTPNSGSGQFKIGVVNLKNVFDAYDKQEAEYKLLQQERDKKQKSIDKLSEKIQANKDRYEAEQTNMSAEERTALEELIESDFTLYKSEFKRLQEDIDRKEKKLLESLFKEIRGAIQEVGAQGNYHLILEGGESGQSGLLYFSTTMNMTQQVTDYLNKKYTESD